MGSSSPCCRRRAAGRQQGVGLRLHVGLAEQPVLDETAAQGLAVGSSSIRGRKKISGKFLSQQRLMVTSWKPTKSHKRDLTKWERVVYYVLWGICAFSSPDRFAISPVERLFPFD